jgi:hypothetical protein
VLTAALKSGKCVSAAKLAANSLMSLGSDAARPALRPLIEAFQVVHLRPVRADLLRALAALCSSADIIQEFETVRLNIAFIVGSFDIQSKPIGSGRQPDRKKKKKKPLLQQCQCLMFGFLNFCVSFCSAEVWPSSSTFCATHAARRILKRNPKLPDSWLKSHLLGWTPRWKMPKPESFVAPATAAATEEISSSQIPTAHGRRSI